MSIGIKNDEIEQVFIGQDERRVLEEFWAAVDGRYFRYCGFNIKAFDIPFITHRSAINGLRPTWPNADIADIFCELFPYGTQRCSKDEVCDAYGIAPEFDGVTGKDVPLLFWRGDLESIRRHCLDDIRREWALFRALRGTVMA